MRGSILGRRAERQSIDSIVLWLVGNARDVMVFM